MELNDTQYRLCAHIIVTGIHGSKGIPPMITGVTPNQKQADTFKDTIMHTSTPIMKVATSIYPSPTVFQTPHIQQTITQSQEAAGERLLKSVASQLDTLKKLFEDGVLTPKEFEEQKVIVVWRNYNEVVSFHHTHT